MLGLEIPEIQRVLGLERIKLYVHDIQRRQFARDPVARVKSLLPDAIDVVEGILTNGAEKTVFKLKAAQDVMDRSMGKANQNISIQTGGISELFDKIDGIERQLKSKVIEAESAKLSDNVEEAEIVDALVRKSKWKQWADENG
jgi:Na+/phosphate symporter